MTENNVRVLVVDDEKAIQRYLTTSLRPHGYQLSLVGNGQEALAEVGQFRPDLIILDLGLPDMDGFEVLRLLRARTRVPIIILSVSDRESEKVRALDSGADDYVTKPFGIGELLAQMRVVMRRPSQAADEPVFSEDGLMVDLARRLVMIDDREVQLTPTEYDLLRALIAQPGRVLTHRQLTKAVWGERATDESHLLRTNVYNLRRKLEADPARPHFILTEAGVGYRLRVSPQSDG